MKHPVILITLMTLVGCVGARPVTGHEGGSGGAAGTGVQGGGSGGAGGGSGNVGGDGGGNAGSGGGGNAGSGGGGNAGSGGGGDAGAGGGGPLAEYPAELRAFTNAYCSVNDRCGATYGAKTVERSLCEFMLARFMTGLAGLAPDTTLNLGAMEACADIINKASCGELVSEIYMKESKCQAAYAMMPSYPTEPGDACVTVCSTGRCLEEKSDGYSCRRCETLAASGESCADVSCAANFYCNTNAGEVCEALATKSCAEDTDCTAHDTRYFCDAGTCTLRKVGAPCLTANECGHGTLRCISGLCAPLAGTGSVCDDPNDCDRNTDTCINNICTAAAGLGEPCTESAECLGWRQCINGTCQNLPELGESCEPQNGCGGGANCIDGLCYVFNLPPLEIGVGQTCWSPNFGPHLSEVIYGICTGSFCDHDGIDGADPTYMCQPYRDFGESCTDSSQCDPVAHACSGGVCRRYRETGETCGVTPCDPATSYCDNGACVALGQFADPCVEGSECASGQCVGVCAGGDYQNLPCFGPEDCPGSFCDGLCGDGSAYPMCRP